jgi:hypothetical protein
MWLKRLVDTRTIYMMPTTNALGYHQNVREENGIDPNRDFAYGTTSCMRTVAARAVNELWLEHAFQLAITFHGGMQAIAYEWGAPDHPRYKDNSPDDNAQKDVGNAMRDFAGRFQTSFYPVGRLNGAWTLLL